MADTVTTLTDITFKQFMSENQTVIVGFYLSILPIHKRFLVEYAEAARSLKDTGVPFAQINCSEEQEVSKFYGGFPRWPTINLFRPGDDVKFQRWYKGGFKSRSISCWVRRQLAPILSDLTVDALDDFRAASEIVAVVYLSGDDKKTYQTFQMVAEKMKDDILFGSISDEAATEAEHVEVPSVVVYKEFDEKKNVLSPVGEVESIESFIKMSAKPLVMEFLPENYYDDLKINTPLAIVIAQGNDRASLVGDIVLPLAKEFEGQIQFGFADVDVFSWLAGEVHVKIDRLPAFAIFDIVRSRKYPMKQPPILSRDILRSFVHDFLGSKLKPARMSAPIPDTQGSVIEVVADTWDEIVLDDNKDVLIEFYTQTCGPCKALLPDYTKLATAYASDPSTKDKIVLGKIDADANDVDADVRGFPTFKFYPAGAKDPPILYDGTRRPQAWANFIRERGGHKAEVALDGRDDES